LDPSVVIVMMSGHGTIETAVKTIKLGAFDFIEKPLHFDKLLLLLEHAFELKNLKDENASLREELKDDERLIGQGQPIEQLRHLISVAAPSNGWVLISGENGTGKELVAKALHRNSPRAKGRFVAVNCAAIPDELIESELFGHEKGSFTGAFDKKIGKFEQADRGTLFLDEVGDMGPKVQAKILRALQECVIQRVGGTHPIEVDIRVVAATNKDLKKLIRERLFREDLFYRLNVIPLFVPPLRERAEDIPLLVDHFSRRFSAGRMPTTDDKMVRMLQKYPWPGNVRELKNWVERASILSHNDPLETTEVEKGGAHDKEWLHGDPFDLEETTLRHAKAVFEKQFILKMLSENGGNVSRTAQRIGVERSHLHKKMKVYGIREAHGTNGVGN